MERFWNYLFYLQWRLLNGFAKKIVQKPIIQFLGFIPFFRKNLKKGKKDLEKFTSDRDLGMNSSFAFNYMFFTTSIIYAIFFIYVIFILDVEVPKNLSYYLFILVFALSYISNYILIRRKDIYLKYFKEFEKQPFSRWHYLYIILFHLGVWTLGILSVNWTVGWHF